MSSAAAPALIVDDVAKTFRLPREQVHTLKERALHPFRRPGHDVFKALDGVSFAVERGEFFGIVGRNGSGKSTLLKCLAGIYRLDRGSVYVDGRVSTFIELGVGFNPDLAAYDNVMLNATMLGLSTKEARRRFDDIIAFAELEEFVDLKVKNYSSGMLVRLAFSVMIQVDADVLMIDEVLAVGDAAFQQKCYDEFARIRRSGATVLLVTHDMGAVRRFCDRAMLIEHGHLVEIGDTETVAERYLQLNFSEDARAEVAAAHDGEDAPAASSGVVTLGPGQGAGAQILEMWVEDETGARGHRVRSGQRCTICFRVRFEVDVEEPLFAVEVSGHRDALVFSAHNAFAEDPEPCAAGETVLVRVAFDNHLGADRYGLTPIVAGDRLGLRVLDRRARALELVVTDQQVHGGLVELPFELTVTHGADTSEAATAAPPAATPQDAPEAAR